MYCIYLSRIFYFFLPRLRFPSRPSVHPSAEKTVTFSGQGQGPGPSGSSQVRQAGNTTKAPKRSQKEVLSVGRDDLPGSCGRADTGSPAAPFVPWRRIGRPCTCLALLLRYICRLLVIVAICLKPTTQVPCSLLLRGVCSASPHPICCHAYLLSVLLRILLLSVLI